MKENALFTRRHLATLFLWEPQKGKRTHFKKGRGPAKNDLDRRILSGEADIKLGESGRGLMRRKVNCDESRFN